jgi:ribosomal protein L19
MNLIAQIEAEQIAALGKTIPDFKAGDTVKVGYKVTEGTRSRVQIYEGVVIGRKGGATISASFTVRKISFGEGVERVFPLYSTNIDAAPSCITFVIVAANLPGSWKIPPTKPQPARKDRTDESRYSPRLSHHQRQNDRWHCIPNPHHLGQGRRSNGFGH